MNNQLPQKSVFYTEEFGMGENCLKAVDLECPIMEYTYVIISNTSKDQQRNIEELSSQVTSSEDVEALLDQVNWRMFVYLCEQACTNYIYSTCFFHGACSNSSCSFTNSTDDIFSSSQCHYVSCTEHNSNNTWHIFFVLGLLCLLGNVVVIYDEITNFLKTQRKIKKIQVYRTLALNLALADLLMGIYLTIMSIESKHKTTIDVYFSEPVLCNVLGVLSTVSTQVSLTLLFLISFFRLRSLTKPFEQQHFKLVTILIILTWIVWILVSVIPLIPLEPFYSIFTFGLARNYRLDRDSFIDFQYIVLFFQTRILPTFENATEVKSVVNAITQFPTPSVMQKFSAALGWVNLDTKEWNLVGYYNFQYACTANFYIFTTSHHYSNYFSFIFVFYNLIVGLLIFIFYVLVTIKVNGRDVRCLSNSKWCNLPSCSGRKIRSNNAHFQSNNAERSAENRRIFKRIAIIVFTDVICWIALGITTLVLWSLHNINQQRKDFFSVFIPFQL